jgi:hypothetical protein
MSRVGGLFLRGTLGADSRRSTNARIQPCPHPPLVHTHRPRGKLHIRPLRVPNPEQMALKMIELVQSGKYTGGTVYLEEKGRSEVVFEGIQDPAKGVDRKRPETRRVQGILTKERRRARSVG